MKLKLRGWCDGDCDCPTCHIGVQKPNATDPLECAYCQKRMFEAGIYDDQMNKPEPDQDNYVMIDGKKYLIIEEVS